MHRSYRTGVMLGLLIPVVIWAANAVLPFAFSSGGAIRASEINANFSGLRDAINAGSSGSRLKVFALRGPDGSVFESSVVGVPGTNGGGVAWDSQLQISCGLKACGPGFACCAPIARANVFSDSTCTQRVALVLSILDFFGQFGGDGGVEQYRFATQTDDQDQVQGFARLGAAQTGLIYVRAFQGLDDGGQQLTCQQTFVGQGQAQATFYPVTGAEPASTFARLDAVLR
jgi:hypothetical protein